MSVDHPYRPQPDLVPVLQERIRTTDRQLATALDENVRLTRENLRLAEIAGRAPVVTQLWEYWVEPHNGLNCDRTVGVLNKAGLDGWELVSSTDHSAFFKRRLVTK